MNYKPIQIKSNQLKSQFYLEGQKGQREFQFCERSLKKWKKRKKSETKIPSIYFSKWVTKPRKKRRKGKNLSIRFSTGKIK